MRVEVYWNLHRDLWSIRALEGPFKGLVIEHRIGVRLSNAQFVVQPAGRDRVRREGRKNVHAFVRGELRSMRDVDSCWWTQDRNSRVDIVDPYMHDYTDVTYNPHRDDTFVFRDSGSPVTHPQDGFDAILWDRNVQVRPENPQA